MEFLLYMTIGACGGFVVGMVFHKLVVSEAAGIKQHITDEVDQVRLDMKEGLAAAAKKV